MYYSGICDSDKCFCLSKCLLALSIWQTRYVMYHMTNFGQIHNFLVFVLVLVLSLTTHHIHMINKYEKYELWYIIWYIIYYDRDE